MKSTGFSETRKLRLDGWQSQALDFEISLTCSWQFSLRNRKMIPQIGRKFSRAWSRVVVQFVLRVRWVFWISSVGLVWIGLHSVLRQWFDREGVRGVKIHVFLEAVGVEEISARPARGKSGQRLRVEVQLHAFSGAENHKAIVGGAQQRLHIAVAGVI